MAIEEKSAIEAAYEEYTARQMGAKQPEGEYDGEKWFPSEAEECSCCQGLRRPSRAYPDNLLKHCRTLLHVATLFGVTPEEVRKFKKENGGAKVIPASGDKITLEVNGNKIENFLFQEGAKNWVCRIYHSLSDKIERNFFDNKENGKFCVFTDIFLPGDWVEFASDSRLKNGKRNRQYYQLTQRTTDKIVLSKVTINDVGVDPTSENSIFTCLKLARSERRIITVDRVILEYCVQKGLIIKAEDYKYTITEKGEDKYQADFNFRSPNGENYFRMPQQRMVAVAYSRKKRL